MDEPQTQNKTSRFTKIYLILWGICILLILIAVIFYNTGFRLTNHLTPTKVGSIKLSSNENNIQIFLDNRIVKLSAADGMYAINNIPPGLHSVMVSKEGFWPWVKSVDVSAGGAGATFAFIFPTEGVAATALSPNSDEYAEALKKISGNVLPAAPEAPPADAPLAKWLTTNVSNIKISADKNTALFTENNAIEIAWVSETLPPPKYLCEQNPCLFQMPITVVTEAIKNVDFYRNRGDIVIFSSGTAIYAIDVDRGGTQNFQPLYRGKNPYFYENADGTLYIKDGATILRASL